MRLGLRALAGLLILQSLLPSQEAGKPEIGIKPGIFPLEAERYEETDRFGSFFVSIHEQGYLDFFFFWDSPKKVKAKKIKGKYYIDKNLDGRIDPKKEAVNETSEIIGLPFNLGGKKAKYFISLYLMDKSDRVSFAGHSLTRLVARFNGLKISIYDSNMNMVFGDTARYTSYPDIMEIETDTKPPVLLYCLPFIKTARIGKKFYNLDIDVEKGYLKISPYSGEIARVDFFMSVKGSSVSIDMVDYSKGLFYKIKDKDVIIPGKYWGRDVNLIFPIISKETDDPVRKFAIHGSMDEIAVKPGKNEIQVGPPFKVDFKAFNCGGKIIDIKDVWLAGAAGGKYKAIPYETTERATLKVFLRAGGKTRFLGNIEYG